MCYHDEDDCHWDGDDDAIFPFVEYYGEIRLCVEYTYIMHPCITNALCLIDQIRTRYILVLEIKV